MSFRKPLQEGAASRAQLPGSPYTGHSYILANEPLHAVPAAPEHGALPHHQPPPADSSMELQPLPHEADGFGPSSFAAGRRDDRASPKIAAQGSNAAALGGLLPTNSKIPLSKQTSLTQGRSAGQGQQYGRSTLEVHTDDEAIQFADEDEADEDTGLISRTPRPQVTPIHGCRCGQMLLDCMWQHGCCSVGHSNST